MESMPTTRHHQKSRRHLKVLEAYGARTRRLIRQDHLQRLNGPGGRRPSEAAINLGQIGQHRRRSVRDHDLGGYPHGATDAEYGTGHDGVRAEGSHHDSELRPANANADIITEEPREHRLGFALKSSSVIHEGEGQRDGEASGGGVFVRGGPTLEARRQLPRIRRRPLVDHQASLDAEQETAGVDHGRCQIHFHDRRRISRGGNGSLNET